jgi:zinc protease
MHSLNPGRYRFLKRLSVLLLLFVTVMISASAQKAMRLPEKDFIRFKLDNGLEVLVVENHLVPIATIELAVRNGSFTEGPEYAGLSHLYEHMFFKGNAYYPESQDLLGLFNSLGILYNAETHEEVVNYYFTLPVLNLERGMEVMAQTVQTPAFDKVELEREREVVLGEFDRHEAAPFFPFHRAAGQALWGDLITRKEPIGQRNVIQTATPEKMRTIQNRYYMPNNSLLIVAGDVDSTQVALLAKKYFTTWKRGVDPFAESQPPMAKPLEDNKLVTVPIPGVDLSLVQYQWHGPSIGIDNASTYAADVFIFILTQPQSGFQQRLVESGLAQDANFHYYTQRYVGPITAQVTTTPEKTKTAMDALWTEIQKFDSPDYFTDEELETAKATLRMRSLYESESTSDWVHSLSFWWSTAGLDYYAGYVDNLSKVTREDIQKFIRQYVKNKPYVLGIGTDPTTLTATLAAMNINTGQGPR